MTTSLELIFRAICSFWDGEYADFTYHSIRNVCSEDALKGAIKTLKKIGSIIDCTANGCARRYKIPGPIECPDFIFDKNFDFYTKIYLLEKWNIYNEGNVFVTNGRQEAKLNLLGTSSYEVIKNAKIIKNKISVPDNLVAEKTEFGYRIKTKSISEEIRKDTYKCRYCGETDKSKFGSQHTVCKKCYNSIDRNRKSYAERLFKSSKSNARLHKWEHNLTPEYIQQILDKQSYKCAYSNIPFYNDKKDKTTYPTIDRIDSNKGYIKGNICICTWLVNTMKSNLTTEQFKDIITKIYENKDNF